MTRKTTSNGQKQPRRERWVKGNALAVAVHRACKLSPEDRELVVAPGRRALAALREGRATHSEWTDLAAVVRIAQAIEKQGIVKGLQQQFDSAKTALQAIYDRAIRPDGWVPSALYAQELNAISEAVRLHKFQLDQLGRGELIAALNATPKTL